MSDHLVRVGNLRTIQRLNEWNDSELARQCGRSPSQVHSWFTNERKIGERLARALEERLQLARYALDDRSGTPHSDDGRSATSAVLIPLPTAKKRLREVPVLPWTDIAEMLDVENATLKQKAPHLETYASTSAQAKFVQMPDDSMASEIWPGDHLLFDPREAPRAGDVVLVRTGAGEHFVRRFRPRTAYAFEAAAANPAYQALLSTDDGIAVVGVMVEHRRYRRPG